MFFGEFYTQIIHSPHQTIVSADFPSSSQNRCCFLCEPNRPLHAVISFTIACVCIQLSALSLLQNSIQRDSLLRYLCSTIRNTNRTRAHTGESGSIGPEIAQANQRGILLLTVLLAPEPAYTAECRQRTIYRWHHFRQSQYSAW